MLDKEKIISLGFDEFSSIKSTFLRTTVRKAIEHNMSDSGLLYSGIDFSDLNVYVKTMKYINTYNFDSEGEKEQTCSFSPSFKNTISMCVVLCMRADYIVDLFMFELQHGIFRYEPDLRAISEAFDAMQEVIRESEAEA